MLTDKQSQILKLIQEYYEEYGVFPSIRQLAKDRGVAPRAIQQYLDVLKRKGFLEDRESLHRSYDLPSSLGASKKQEDVLRYDRIPLVGAIAAGSAKPGFEVQDQTLDLSAQLFGTGKDLFALKISGESMSGDYICDGDIVMIHRQNTVKAHEIAALRIEPDEFTLKRIKQKGDHVELIPSNPAFSVVSVRANQVEVIGKYVGLIRRPEGLSL